MCRRKGIADIDLIQIVMALRSGAFMAFDLTDA